MYNGCIAVLSGCIQQSLNDIHNGCSLSWFCKGEIRILAICRASSLGSCINLSKLSVANNIIIISTLFIFYFL